MPKKRIGFLIEAFDPVHLGHLQSAEHALKTDGLDQVVFLPAGSPEEGSCAAGPEDRWRLTVIACAGSADLVPSRLFLDSGALSRDAALDLLRHEFPDAKLFPVRISPEPSPAYSSASIRRACAEGRVPEGLTIPLREYISCTGLYSAPGRIPEAAGWITRLFSDLKPRRFAHSLAVADMAKKMASRFDADPLKAEKAGLLHDCAKCIPLPEMQRIAGRNHLDVDSYFMESTALLHSVVGAWCAEHWYGVKDPDILEAISFHNTGHAGMSRLAMCVCLADSIELTRPPYPFLEEVRSLAETSLEGALLLSLERTAEYVSEKGKFLHPRTVETIRWLRSLPSAGNR